MIVHILRMYNSKHLRTWDESLPYVQHSYKPTTEPYIAQPTTTPFRLGWDSNHWVPWMLHYLLRPPCPIHHLLHLKLTKPPDSVARSGSVGSVIFQKFSEAKCPGSVCYIYIIFYIYCIYIQKNM
jgi:hypothetical protein